MCQGHIGDVGDDKHDKHGASSMVSQMLLGFLGHFWRLIILITEYVYDYIIIGYYRHTIHCERHSLSLATAAT